MMPLLVEEEEMRKKREQKNVSSLTEMILDSGTLKINVRSSGISTMEEKLLVNLLEFSQSVIGQKWMYGNTSKKKILNFQVSTFLIKEMW